MATFIESTSNDFALAEDNINTVLSIFSFDDQTIDFFIKESDTEYNTGNPIINLIDSNDTVILNMKRSNEIDNKENISQWTLPQNNTFNMYEHLFNQYITTGYLNGNVQYLIGGGSTSLALMQNFLQTKCYRTKYEPAINWLQNILDDLLRMDVVYDNLSPSQQWIFLAKHLLKVGNQTIRDAEINILAILRTAKSELAIQVMCDRYLQPHDTYRTVKTINDQFEFTMNKIGQVSNEFILISDLMSIIPETIPHLMDMPLDYCISNELQYRIKNLYRITDFVAFTRKHPEIKVMIKSSFDNATILYLATTTANKSCICMEGQRHLWAFMNRCRALETIKDLHTDEYISVSHTVPMYEYNGYTENDKNILFVSHSISLKNNTKTNCCRTEFLDKSLQQTCGPTFESINILTHIPIPDEPYAIGLGKSLLLDTKDTSKLFTPLYLLIHGIYVRITHI